MDSHGSDETALIGALEVPARLRGEALSTIERPPANQAVMIRGQLNHRTGQIESRLLHPVLALLRSRADFQRRSTGRAGVGYPVNDCDPTAGAKDLMGFPQQPQGIFGVQDVE